MQHDRLIHISIGKSRTSKDWQRTEMLWNEFVRRLQVPIRTDETVEAYHRLPKREQVRLKDVGGFVGGMLNGTQRKASNVISRDLVTLDMDAIAPGGTEDVVRRVDGLGAAYAIYSTRSHTEARPRLRVILPADRPLTADEYEPTARKLASVIGIDLCDP
ncbi:MAG: virulence-associated protein E, partial [Selenomonas sp.]